MSTVLRLNQQTTVSNARMDKASAKPRWLFSARVDVSVFLGSALASLLLLLLGGQFGLLNGESPAWTWISAVLLVDVAHVWASNYRVYFDFAEVRRRPVLYALAPLMAYAVGVALYSESALTFWRALAYLAVFHFVRQQWGWVALYRARNGETGKLGKRIDAAAVYLATLYPLVWWHAHLPRGFSWFIADDFAPVSVVFEKILFPFYVVALALYIALSLYRAVVRREYNPGKDIVVLTTAVCWYVGIVAFNSDYAFTVTNVLIHGVPYFALVYFYARRRRAQNEQKSFRLLTHNIWIFLLTLWALAYAEELLWDKSVWHERGWLFGANWNLDEWKMWLVPLLALPQATHYILDGFIWRRKNNPPLMSGEK